jgi:hypothetical protein
VSRVVDRGAITAAYVGIGMAVTVGVSFLLVIPIEPIFWLLALPAGAMIGYYANQRSDRRAGPWLRILANAAFAGLVTGLTMVALLLAVKALFFFADDGYRDPGLGGRITIVSDDGRPQACAVGAGCVYERYLDANRGSALAAAGINDANSFGAFYWSQQRTTAVMVLGLTFAGGLLGGFAYGITRPKAAARASLGRAGA